MLEMVYNLGITGSVVSIQHLDMDMLVAYFGTELSKFGYRLLYK